MSKKKAVSAAAIKLLDKAGDLIERSGWIRHHYGNPRDGYCMMGALYAAGSFIESPSADIFAARIEALEAIAHQADQALPVENGPSPFHWGVANINDALVQDEEEALELLWLARDELAQKIGL